MSIFCNCDNDHERRSNRALLIRLIFISQKIMASIKDIQDQNAALIQAVADEDTVIDSAVVLIEGNLKILTDLQAQLAAAGTDATALQALNDSLVSTIATISEKKTALAKAVQDGTAVTSEVPSPSPAP
jgi:hypothetical protein